jgi:hypothetical protein
MANPAEEAVETWDLSAMLAVLCQVAQGAHDAAGAPEANREPRIVPELPAGDREGSLS